MLCCSIIYAVFYPSAHSAEAQWSVQALRILAELLAPLLDVLYQSEEKDRVLPLLTGVMCHVTPYLKEHRSVTHPVLPPRHTLPEGAQVSHTPCPPPTSHPT